MTAADRAQIEAAAPDRSTWLGANAGSGKTRVLTDRVARLLLAGVRPERILCLTYTKAAAMEMQNRLFRRLGEWAMRDDRALSDALAGAGVSTDALTSDTLSQARTLFARAIEAPGGLKIQTIHSFCAAVLRRFPLEAGVGPGFTEMDERVQTRLIADLLDELAADPATMPVIDALAAHLGDDDGMVRLARGIAGETEAFDAPATWAELCALFEIAPELTEERLADRVRLGGVAALCARVAGRLDPGNRTQARPHRVLISLDWATLDMAGLEALEGVLLTGPSAKNPFVAKIDGFANGDVRAAMGADLEALHALMRRVEAARPLRLGLTAARRADALHRFAAAFLPAYAAAKQARGWMDFDDLIARTRDLMAKSGAAQWVLFRLDGGIDHILIDEAQDTSPGQWGIVARLAEDFAAGDGARPDVRRTIFVVGDKKQSIYSFQGADPAGFDRMRDHFAGRLRRIGAPFQDRALLHSFRSAPPILRLVDRVAASAAGGGLGDGVRHLAFFEDKPGRVDLWPVIESEAPAQPPDWDDPQDLLGVDHHVPRLARQIADRVERMIASGEPILDREGRRRAVTPGDILILVQRRSPLFRAIIAALKARGLPIAGVDRAQIADPLAVRDLLSLMRFLATPEDDLSLAEVLRSPLGGLSEADLFDLAHPRPRRESLWRALRARRQDWPHVFGMLADLRGRADVLRPYDLLERALIRHDGRRRLLARLGLEAEDGIDAMLAQALAFERAEVPSLTGFVGWLESGDVVVKRDLARPCGDIRVMTVHGAKGLEAPVVILPDTGRRHGPRARVPLVQIDGGPMAWAPGKRDDAPPALRAALERRDAAEAAERDRLLYVAMTRAECWLIVAAAGDVGKSPSDSWYGQVAAAIDALGGTPLPIGDGPGRRIETGDWGALPPHAPGTAPPVALPDWAGRTAPRPPRDRSARTPSDLGGAKTVPSDASPDGAGQAAALRHGRLVHLLLEHLPRFPAASWPTAAPGICGLEAPDVTDPERRTALAEAERVLTAPALAPLFRPDALAEVEVSGRSAVLDAPVLGAVDRLIVAPGRVRAVDFKTNRVVPATVEEVPEGLLRQMGAYAEILAAIYPDHAIETEILWSRTAELMPLPGDLVHAALLRAAAA